MGQNNGQFVSDEWVSFPGGELEGQRPKVLCAACRDRLQRGAAGGNATNLGRTLCFQCYRAGLERDRALRAAGTLDTASEARFQYQLPLEPLDSSRLAILKTQRAEERGVMLQGAERFADKRRRAQIAARHALQTIAAGLRSGHAEGGDRDRALAMAIHAAELQLPDAWLPFVVSR